MAVRTHAGMFDVSHMGEVEVEGPGALGFLQLVLSNDVAKIELGGAQYSCLCAEDGGVLDDLFAYRLGGDRYLLVTNSANHEADLAWLGRWSRQLGDVAVRDVADRYAMLAVQGPHARAIVGDDARRRAAAADAGRRGPRRRPPGAGLRHRLHRRGRDRAAARPRDRAGDLGRAARRRRRPLRARRPRHPAARGLLPPARQRPHPRAQSDRSRPRLVLCGGDRLHRLRGDRPRARRGAGREAGPVQDRGRRHPPSGQPGAQRRTRRSASSPPAPSRPRSKSGSGWPTCGPTWPSRAPRSRSTCAASAARPG